MKVQQTIFAFLPVQSGPHTLTLFFFYLKVTPGFRLALLYHPMRSTCKAELLALEGTCVHGRLLHPWDLTHVYLQLSEWKQGSDNVKSRETWQYPRILKNSNQKILVLFWVWRVRGIIHLLLQKQKLIVTHNLKTKADEHE